MRRYVATGRISVFHTRWLVLLSIDLVHSEFSKAYASYWFFNVPQQCMYEKELLQILLD